MRETRRQIERGRSLADCPPLGGWWKDEGASRKDGLSGLVRVWPALGYLSLLAHLNTQTHTSPSVSHHPSFQITHCLPPVTQPRQKLRDVQIDTRLFIISKDSGQLLKKIEQGHRCWSCWRLFTTVSQPGK